MIRSALVSALAPCPEGCGAPAPALSDLVAAFVASVRALPGAWALAPEFAVARRPGPLWALARRGAAEGGPAAARGLTCPDPDCGAGWAL